MAAVRAARAHTLGMSPLWVVIKSLYDGVTARAESIRFAALGACLVLGAVIAVAVVPARFIIGHVS